tara:strand:+ start:398 stop:502 length:105 start_codon:yes stop_codon:yes gene_type:complete
VVVEIQHNLDQQTQVVAEVDLIRLHLEEEMVDLV